MAEQSTTREITVRTIRDQQAWDAIEPDWSLLFAASRYAATPLRFSWLRNWWRCYGSIYSPNARGLRVITIWRGRQLIGALPLYLSTTHVPFLTIRRIGFISTGETQGEETCPDYMNMLCLPGEEQLCVRKFQETVRRESWDFIELLNVPEHSPLLNEFGWSEGSRETIPAEGCPIADLQGGFDAYLRRLNSKHRKNARRVLRSVAEADASLEIADASNAATSFDDLIRIHQERWNAVGKPGCFGATRFTQFHRALALEGVPQGHAALARLMINSRPAAVIYGFITGRKFDVYQCGVSIHDRGPVASPGIAAHLLLMAALCDRGVTCYDLLSGASQYKHALATRIVPLYTVRAWRPTVRALAHKSLIRFGRTVKPELHDPHSQVA